MKANRKKITAERNEEEKLLSFLYIFFSVGIFRNNEIDRDLTTIALYSGNKFGSFIDIILAWNLSIKMCYIGNFSTHLSSLF